MRFAAALAIAGLFSLCGPAAAVTDAVTVQWLGKIAAAAQRLNYSGTFIYQAGEISETSRIMHTVDAAGEQEKLEVLDGSPREVIRANDEVRCFLPREKVVIVEKRTARKSFPALFSGPLNGVTEFYVVKSVDRDRVAGIDAQVLSLDPKDTWRHGYRLWVEPDSGLLLKARMVNDRGEVVEQFTFTEVAIGAVAPKEAMRPRYGQDHAAEWRVLNRLATETATRDSRWQFRNLVPGFRKVAEMKRSGPKQGQTDVLHVVFSDGLAAISVFIEPLPERPARPANGVASRGPINLYFRTVADQLVTVLGEVPSITLKRLGDGIESIRSH